ncbi:MAG: DegQ family serine endoprotease [Calditrichia bacterium]
MNEKPRQQRFWVFVLAGIIMGVLITAGLEWTHTTQANPLEVKASTSEAVPPQTNQGGSNVAQQLSDVFASVAEQANPSVVTVFTETKVKAQQGSPFGGDEFFRKFFQIPEHQGNLTRMGLGSGVIVDANGVILTNNHVVEGADNIQVQLMDGREFNAKVKGTDPLTDLAVITIEAKNLKPINFGSSEKLRVGDWVLAIGSPLNPELEHTVTAGIISAKGRTGVGLSQYEDYLQTDAAINPGNSGGALVNMNGELVGINSAIATQTGGFQGIGFAIPVDLAKVIMNDIITKGKVIRGWLGVYIQNITPEIAKALKLNTAQGVIVSKVQSNSPAEKAGLKAEDVIVKYDDRQVNTAGELSTWVSTTSPGTEVNIGIIRNDKPMTIKVKIGELSSAEQKSQENQTSYSSIGLEVANITPDLIQQYKLQPNESGVVITAVDPNGLAAQVGMQPGDVVLKLNREPVTSVTAFNKIIKSVKPGENLLFYMRRGEGNYFAAFTMPGK